MPAWVGLKVQAHSHRTGYGGIEHRQLANELECRAYQEWMICATRLRDGGLGGAAVDKAYSRAVKEGATGNAMHSDTGHLLARSGPAGVPG